MSTLAKGKTVPLARKFTAKSFASALTVVTVTGGPTVAEAADAGADAAMAAGAALAEGAEGATSAVFLSLQAVMPKPKTNENKAKVIFLEFIKVRFFDVRRQVCGIWETQRIEISAC